MNEQERDAPRTSSLRADLQLARGEANDAAFDDGPYGEIMATYTALGELLEARTRPGFALTDLDFEADCRALVERLQALGTTHDRYSAQRFAVHIRKLCDTGTTEAA